MTPRTKEKQNAALAGHDGFSLITDEKLIQLYTTMLKCRRLQERARTLGAEVNDGCDTITTGQEAIAAGVAIDLQPEDTIACSSREVIFELVHGEPLEKILASRLGSNAHMEYSAQFNFAIEAAQANKGAKNGKIAVVVVDERSLPPGIWQQMLTQAGSLQLPILFVCPVTGGGDEENTRRAEASGFPGIAVDGSDVVAVYRVATEAITHARKGNGATLIECKLEGSKASDPLLKMEAYLSRKGLYRTAIKQEAESRFDRELNAALATASAGRLPRSSKAVAGKRNS
ncbi:MAG: thiamine pyrophosphate-dependent enzyme [Terracidiphilus sp.]|jgi:pyruvate dehydrogenase E1 component alpha subunit